jgi:ABC-type lipoprotein release transport system permease subunit
VFSSNVFYARYLRNELLRRRTRTIVTLIGLGLGVALVIAISSLSNGLDRAQKKTLNPLAGIGTDLTVTLAPQQNQGGGFGGPGGGGASRDLIQANQSVITDLSKLGKPGTHFVHDFFLPGTQLTFKQTDTKQISSIAGVGEVTQGLTLLAQHQEGIVPKIVATLKTQAKTITQVRNIPRPTAAEFAAMQACFAKLGGGTRSGNNNSFGGGGGGFGGGARPDRGAFSKCLPERLRRLRATFTSPSQTLRQVLNPPQTNITTTAYTIGGVDQTNPTMGIVTTAQVTKGRYLAAAGGREALISQTYAAKHSLKVGSTLDLNGTRFTVVGLVAPPLGGQSADVYLPLKQLQTLANEAGLANVVLVRATSSSNVANVQKAIEAALPQAQVASSKQVAAQISGSLVDASNLSKNLGFALSVIAAVAAFLLAALLALSSVGKRTRELGTLKALGWTQRMVVRQIAGESLAQGVLGGVFGILFGLLIIAAVNAFGPTLSASSTTGDSSLLGLGVSTARTATSSISLSAPVGVPVLATGFGLALLGGLVAGTAGAMRAARLRPGDALRQVD